MVFGSREMVSGHRSMVLPGSDMPSALGLVYISPTAVPVLYLPASECRPVALSLWLRRIAFQVCQSNLFEGNIANLGDLHIFQVNFCTICEKENPRRFDLFGDKPPIQAIAAQTPFYLKPELTKPSLPAAKDVSHLNSVLLSLSEQYSGCSWTFSLICRTWISFVTYWVTIFFKYFCRLAAFNIIILTVVLLPSSDRLWK